MANQDKSVAEKIAARLVSSDPLLPVLKHRSVAYGSVSGALDNLAGYVRRDQTSDAAGRMALDELRDAIHAPREQATQYANRLLELVREVA